MSNSPNNIGVESVAVSSIMIDTVKTATESQTILEVCKMMDEYKIGSIVILKNHTNANNEDKRPIGIVMERHIVCAIRNAGPFSIHTPVREIMSRHLITLNPNSSIRDAM
jgi:CBS domain-containing protein